jgi:hypothetical protein
LSSPQQALRTSPQPLGLGGGGNRQLLIQLGGLACVPLDLLVPLGAVASVVLQRHAEVLVQPLERAVGRIAVQSPGAESPDLDALNGVSNDGLGKVADPW